MKKIIYSIAFAVIVIQNVSAQNMAAPAADTTKHLQNGWYFEAGGASLLGATFNYERYLGKQPGGFTVRIGAGGGIVPGIFDDNAQLYAAIPAGLSYNIPVSANKHYFIEIGATYTFIAWGDYNSQIISGNIGWRYESPLGKLLIRLTLLPVVYSVADKSTLGIPWFGFSIGKRF